MPDDTKQQKDSATAAAVAAQAAPAPAAITPTAPAPAPAAKAAPAPQGTTAGIPVAGLDERQRLARLEQIAIQGRPGFSVGPTPEIDRTVPGGKYRVGDSWQNADGEEIDEQGNLLHPERARKDQFGRMTTIR